MENTRDSESFYLNEWGGNPLEKHKDAWGEELLSESLKPRRIERLMYIFFFCAILFFISVLGISIPILLWLLFFYSNISIRITYLLCLIIASIGGYFFFIFGARVIYSNIRTENGHIMRIFKNGIYFKFGFYYKSPTKELATEMFFPFEEIHIVPIFSQKPILNEMQPKIRLWQIWHKKYDFYGKLSPYSGSRLISALRDILTPDELKKIVKDYESLSFI